MIQTSPNLEAASVYFYSRGMIWAQIVVSAGKYYMK